MTVRKNGPYGYYKGVHRFSAIFVSVFQDAGMHSILGFRLLHGLCKSYYK